MIDFNNIYITPDGSYVMLDISVKDLSYYANMYISGIYIDTQSTYMNGRPSDSTVYKYIVEGDKKHIVMMIPSSEILASLSTDLLFIWVTMKGTVTSDTPCGMDKTNIVFPLYNQRRIFDLQVPYLMEVSDTRSIPKNFINMFLQKEAVDTALETENYTTAISLWNKFFNGTNSTNTVTSCGCHE